MNNHFAENCGCGDELAFLFFFILRSYFCTILKNNVS